VLKFNTANGDVRSGTNGGARNQLRVLTPLELEWKQRVLKKILRLLDLTQLSKTDNQNARGQIRDLIEKLFLEESAPLSLAQRQLIASRLVDEVMGLGPLEPLLADPTISDILINGYENVFLERSGKLERSTVRFQDDAHLMNIIDRIVSAVGRRVDESSPMVDARLKDGSRVNVIIPPLAIDGPVLSIRRFAVERLTPEKLVEFGTLTAQVTELLKAIVRGRLNVMISGGTGSGKTTLLNVLSGFIPENERIVTIEDSAELQLRQPHVVRLETRPPNIEGRGQVTQRDLVRNSLRMRPDRIVVGEVRGAEAVDMLQAMNTGHDGSLTTIHANSARDALSRVETMVAMSDIHFPIQALRAQIASAINVVIHIERQEDGTRRLISLQEINGMEGETITMTEIFRFVRQDVTADHKVIGSLKPTGIVPGFYKRLKQRGVPLPLETFRQAIPEDPNR
jgi:pilus assembly protein CpaF